jgi:hypothetical protein
MWRIQGKPVDTERFHPFEAKEVLYEFDGPRIFTLLDADGELNLAYWSDEDEAQARFIVVPTAFGILTGLRSGGVSVLEALDQPRCWVCDVSHTGDVKQCFRVDFDAIPRDSLPVRGTMLLSVLEPVQVDLEGRVRELDKDQRSFELREINGIVLSQKFAFDESLRDDVYRAFDDEVRVKLAGWRYPGKPIMTAVSLSPLEPRNPQKRTKGAGMTQKGTNQPPAAR